MKNNIINFSAEKIKHVERRQRTQEKECALSKLEPNSNSSPYQWNHDFYALVDLFLKETYPDAFWQFDVWLEKIRNK